jgi:geranylgeranyl diphosphate synthase type II
LDIKGYLAEKKRMVDEALNRYLPAEGKFPPQIYRAMRYSIFAGGKRLRPILVIAGAEAVGGQKKDTLPVACAIELIHTFSLIHDDLPAMDNDDYRRGKAASHKAFGEALAILAGDALLIEAFQLMTNKDLTVHLDPGRLIKIINEITTATGHSGMIGGQVVDIELEGKEAEIPILEYIHTHKTGALIMVSVRAGAQLGKGSPEEIELLSKYGGKIGLAFQIMDDISDIQKESEKLRKEVGSDLKKSKVTYPAILGARKSKKRVAELIQEATCLLKTFDQKADPLREIAKYIANKE